MLLWKSKLKDKLYKYVYSAEVVQRYFDSSCWGDPINFSAINGRDAVRLSKAAKIHINGNLIDDCLYIFRESNSGNLIPYRVSMHPKTLANIEHGSRHYGRLSIMTELEL